MAPPAFRAHRIEIVISENGSRSSAVNAAWARPFPCRSMTSTAVWTKSTNSPAAHNWIHTSYEFVGVARTTWYRSRGVDPAVRVHVHDLTVEVGIGGSRERQSLGVVLGVRRRRRPCPQSGTPRAGTHNAHQRARRPEADRRLCRGTIGHKMGACGPSHRGSTWAGSVRRESEAPGRRVPGRR